MPVVRSKSNPEESCIAKAIEALVSGEQRLVLAAHKVYNVPYKKLLGRYTHRADPSHGGQNKALDKV
jgi:hypothetical protein